MKLLLLVVPGLVQALMPRLARPRALLRTGLAAVNDETQEPRRTEAQEPRAVGGTKLGLLVARKLAAATLAIMLSQNAAPALAKGAK